MSQSVALTSWSSDLALRSLSAAIALPIVVGLIWIGGTALFFGAICVIAIAIIELTAIVRRIGWQPMGIIAFGGSLLLTAGAYFLISPKLFWIATALLVFISILWSAHHGRSIAMICTSLLTTILLSTYIGIPIACMLILRRYDIWWVLTVLFATTGFDTGAYFAGRKFGRHKLWIKVSPMKSWEGFAGGLACCVPITVLCLTLRLHVLWPVAATVGVVIACATTVGDLAESALKRKAGVKDSGYIMPGHGGLLDRIDGLLWTAVVVWLCAVILRR